MLWIQVSPTALGEARTINPDLFLPRVPCPPWSFPFTSPQWLIYQSEWKTKNAPRRLKNPSSPPLHVQLLRKLQSPLTHSFTEPLSAPHTKVQRPRAWSGSQHRQAHSHKACGGGTGEPCYQVDYDERHVTRSSCFRRNAGAGTVAHNVCHFLCHDCISRASWALWNLLRNRNPNEGNRRSGAPMGIDHGLVNPQRP